MGLLSTLGTIGGSILGGPVGGAIGGALGGAIEGNPAEEAINRAATLNQAATDRSLALQERMYNEGVERQKPWLTAGTGAINRLAAGLQKGGEFGTPFSQTNWQQDPGYAFRMSEGLKALDRQAASRGGLISGAALKAAQRYGQDYGSQEYQNAFDRYYNERNQMLRPLQSLAGIGQTSADTISSAGTGYANRVGNALLNQADVAGNAGIAVTNARNSTYGNIGSALGQVTPGQWQQANNYLTSWLNPGGYYPYGGGNLDVGNVS